MNATSIDTEIENIYSRFKSAGIELDKNKIRDKLNYLLGYKVPLNEAMRTVTMVLRKDYNLPFESFKPGNAGLVPIASVKEDNKWVTVRGKVLQLWEPRSDSISQIQPPKGTPNEASSPKRPEVPAEPDNETPKQGAASSILQESEIMVLEILRTHKPQDALARDTIQNVLRALGYAMLDVDSTFEKLKMAGEIIEPKNGFFRAV
jgi:hypothetical protein